MTLKAHFYLCHLDRPNDFVPVTVLAHDSDAGRADIRVPVEHADEVAGHFAMLNEDGSIDMSVPDTFLMIDYAGLL